MSETIFECKCGWQGPGSELIEQGCVTDSDQWWICPNCRKQDFSIKRSEKKAT